MKGKIKWVQLRDSWLRKIHCQKSKKNWRKEQTTWSKILAVVVVLIDFCWLYNPTNLFSRLGITIFQTGSTLNVLGWKLWQLNLTHKFRYFKWRKWQWSYIFGVKLRKQRLLILCYIDDFLCMQTCKRIIIPLKRLINAKDLW